jgi:hypothetical protein
VRTETPDDPQRDGPTEYVLAGFISQTSIQLLTRIRLNCLSHFGHRLPQE